MTEHHPLRRVVITAGPTHEPIDAVRYLANRSSGRLGIALAAEAERRAWDVTLLLGPVELSPNYTQVRIKRFTTAADLQALLMTEAKTCDVLIMAAAVADFRPPSTSQGTKIRRSDGTINLVLESTPDLLAEFAASRRPGQLIIGFALESRDLLEVSAREKLARKGVDGIVANPLETMGADTIEASLIWRDAPAEQTPGPISKDAFASWLLDLVEKRQDSKEAHLPSTG